MADAATWQALIITVRKGSTGPAVRAVQDQVNFRNNKNGHTLNVDGIYGPKTQAAVRAFQQAEGGQLSAPTVVIQHTKVRTSRFLEAGSRPPYAETTGSGTAVVLRGGHAYDSRWSRPGPGSGTTFTTTSGQPMTFARGPVWIVLAAAR